MPHGIIKFFDNKTNGFGFIVPDDGSREIYFHESAIKESRVKALISIGQKVSFERGSYKGKSVAVNLAIIAGPTIESVEQAMDYASQPQAVAQRMQRVLAMLPKGKIAGTMQPFYIGKGHSIVVPLAGGEPVVIRFAALCNANHEDLAFSGREQIIACRVILQAGIRVAVDPEPLNA